MIVVTRGWEGVMGGSSDYGGVECVETRHLVARLEYPKRPGDPRLVSLRIKAASKPWLKSLGGWVERAEFPDMASALRLAAELEPLIEGIWRARMLEHDARYALTTHAYKLTFDLRRHSCLAHSE